MKYVMSGSREIEEEKKHSETMLAFSGLIKPGDASVLGRNNYGLLRPKPRTASREAASGDTGVDAASAMVRSLSKSLKRDLSITNCITGISSHNLPSLSKTLKRNLSKGSQGADGAHPNETFSLFDGMEDRASLFIEAGQATSHGARSITPEGSATPTQGCDTSKEANRSISQVTSMSLFAKMGCSVKYSKEQPNTSRLIDNDTEKKYTPSDPQQQKQETRIVRALSAPQLCEEQSPDMAGGDAKPNQLVETSPDGFYKSTISQLGYNSDSISSLELKDYFLEYTPDQIAAYDHAVIRAVRSDDVDALRRLFLNGKTMQCSNKFGESIVHMACRKGSLSVIHFLLEEAGVSLRVRDDLGRTPLHDACWASKPSFEAIRMLIQKEPDLLLLADRRGNTPLEYVRDDKWVTWCEFLHSASSLLAPQVLFKLKE